MKNKVPNHEREWGWTKLARAAQQSGISRPELFRYVVSGEILGSHIRKPGASKGVWLVNLASVDEFIRSFLPGGSRYQRAGTKSAKEERRREEAL
jgi:hypothetical protein